MRVLEWEFTELRQIGEMGVNDWNPGWFVQVGGPEVSRAGGSRVWVRGGVGGPSTQGLEGRSPLARTLVGASLMLWSGVLACHVGANDKFPQGKRFVSG